MPQQCTEERPPLPGWLYSPLSPSGDLSPMTSWYPSLRWPYSPVSPTRYSPTTPERGGSPREGTVGDPPPLTPTQPPSVQRHGPDYALRDYLQGNRDRATHHLQWPYSPLTPSTPRPVPSPAPPPGNTDWMDSQGSEKGKNPVGKKGANKGAGGKTCRDRKGERPASDKNNRQGNGKGGGPSGAAQPSDGSRRKGGRASHLGKDTTKGGPIHPGERQAGRDTEGGARPRGGGVEGRAGRRDPQGAGGVETRGRVPETPSLPTQSEGRESRVLELGERGSPMGLVREQGGTTPPIAPTRNPPYVTTTLLMDKKDDRAPHKLFEAIKPLTGRVLSPAEWTQWCQRLDRWTAGLSRWSSEREKTYSPQQAWARRQSQKRRKNASQQGQERGESPETNPDVGGPQTGRNRTITRMANLQRLYNRAPRKCMDSVRKSPQPQRCEVPVEEVDRFFRSKYDDPGERAAAAAPPFPLWEHPKGTDVLQDPISLSELKRVLQKMDGNTSPGPDRIGYRTYEIINL